MEFWAKILGRTISGVLSILDATNLRNRVYQIEDEHELMWTSLDDIARIHKDHPAGEMAKRTLKNIQTTYGR